MHIMYFYVVVENATDIIDEIDIGTPIVPDTTNGWVTIFHERNISNNYTHY